MTKSAATWPPRVGIFGSKVQVGGRSFRLRAHDLRTFQLVNGIVKCRPAQADPLWLIRHRAALRELQQLNARVGLNWLLEQSRAPEETRMALWLRGRCGGSLGTPIVARYLAAQDDRSRKEAVRALRHMNAWAELSAVAEQDANPRLRRLARFPEPPDVHTRVARYAERVRAVPHGEPSRTLYVNESVTLDEPTRSRPLRAIRAILERIRQLVRGNLTNG